MVTAAWRWPAATTQGGERLLKSQTTVWDLYDFDQMLYTPFPLLQSRRRTAMPSVLQISCDEAGHTGPDLLHAEQAYFGFGSVSIDDAEAWDIIAKARRDNPVQMPELKASKLMRSPRGRSLIGALVRDAEGR